MYSTALQPTKRALTGTGLASSLTSLPKRDSFHFRCYSLQLRVGLFMLVVVVGYLRAVDAASLAGDDSTEILSSLDGFGLHWPLDEFPCNVVMC